LLIVRLPSDDCSKLITLEVTRWAELGDLRAHGVALASGRAANVSAKSGVDGTFRGRIAV
jgi:hypothetical protein